MAPSRVVKFERTNLGQEERAREVFQRTVKDEIINQVLVKKTMLVWQGTNQNEKRQFFHKKSPLQ